MSESRKIFDIGAFEFELGDKFLPHGGRDESTNVPNNFADFEVDPYSVIGRAGLVQLRGEDPERLVQYHSEAPLVRLGTVCQWCTEKNCRHNILMEFD